MERDAHRPLATTSCAILSLGSGADQVGARDVSAQALLSHAIAIVLNAFVPPDCRGGGLADAPMTMVTPFGAGARDSAPPLPEARGGVAITS